MRGFGQTFPLQPQRFFVFFQAPVYSRGAYRFQLFRYLFRDLKRRPLCDMLHLLPHERGEDFSAFAPEELPGQAESGDGLIGIDPLPFAIGGPFFFRFEFHRLPVRIDQGFPDRLAA
jgi:hypothetical protein